MLTSAASDEILSSNSVNVSPALFAEWNYNLFMPPYITVAGNGSKITPSVIGTAPVESTVIKENFTTKKLVVSGTNGSISYSAGGLTGSAYKVVTYIRTNSLSPIVVNTYATSGLGKYGSYSDEAVSFSWKKFEFIIGSSEALNSMEFTISASSKSSEDSGYEIYFTVPEIYETTGFDYYNGNLWPTKSPFNYFRPGESYINTGNKNISFPSNYRRIASKTYYEESLSGGFYGNKYTPVSRVMCNPNTIILNNPAAYSGSSSAYQNPLLKNGMISDIMPYKYFISDETNKKITAIYEKNIYVNKIVLKFNTMIYVPTVTVTIGATVLTNQTPDANGILVLYWDGTTWSSTKKWTKETPVPSGSVAMPVLSSEGDIALKTAINKITVEQTGQTVTSLFNNSYFTISEFQRMNLIECSPRLEVDLSNYLLSFNIEKSLDNDSEVLPISPIDSNNATFTLSNIPAFSVTNGVIPIFSNESTNQYSVLSKMLVKNIKMYPYLQINNTAGIDGFAQYTNEYIPLGVFYSDSWVYEDDTTISVECFDITRYLQSTSVIDYAGQLLKIEDIISNILDFSGFTDYDYDSLKEATNDKNINMDLAYYFANSKDTTIFNALRELFLAYQISAYIDEYGIMKFKSLPSILLNQEVDIEISDANIIDGGYSIENKSIPGKISMRYAPPKIKQSASLQNIEDQSIALSPSFVLTTQNDVVWQQQNFDSVGFNYLDQPTAEEEPSGIAMSKTSNRFKLKVADLLDIFYTYSRDYNGYAFIEDEIVSFEYKEYKISQISKPENFITVSIKNDFELKSKINQFVKEYGVGLGNTFNEVTTATYSSGGASGATSVVIQLDNKSIRAGQSITGTGFASNTKVISVSGTTVNFSPAATSQISGVLTFSVKNPSDILIEPTGFITNVKRGAFGTKVKSHTIISETASPNADLATKNLQQRKFDAMMIEADNVTIEDSKILVEELNGETIYIYPTNELEEVTSATVTANGGAGSTTFLISAPNALIQPGQIIDNGISGGFTDVTTVIDVTDTTVTFSPAASGLVSGTVTFYEKVDKGGLYKTYSTTFTPDFAGSGDFAAGLFFNLPSAENSDEGLYQVYLNYVKATDKYTIVIEYNDGTNLTTLYTADVTRIAKQVYDNVPQVFKVSNAYEPGDTINQKYQVVRDRLYHLKVVHDIDDPEVGNIDAAHPGAEILRVYLNGIEINQWGTLDNTEEISRNNLGLPRYAILPVAVEEETIFGTMFRGNPFSSNEKPCRVYLREIYACNKALTSKTDFYFHKTPYFLNSLACGRKVEYKTYMMQTRPAVSGLNYYDVQYTTPAATVVDVLPVQYLLIYQPTDYPNDMWYRQKLNILEHAVKYSCPINTGFRARMLIANNSPMTVYLNKDSDSTILTTVRLNLWTHQIIAMSDEEIIEYNINENNLSEVAQLDSEWVQSTDAAYGILNTVSSAIEGFSYTTTIQIFGNPLIQVGDIVSLTYPMAGVSAKKYIVTNVSQNYDSGLSTSLGLKRI